MNPARMLRENHAWVLIALTLLLFCTKTLFNFPLWIMSFIGLARVLRDPRCLLRDPVFRLLGAMFLCIWLPQLAALPDALAPSHASETIFPYLHFLFAAIYVAEELRDERTLRLVSWSIAIILGFWCVDALLQFASGSNLFGYPYTPGQLGGMFYPKVRLGHMLALLAPLYFEILRRHFPGSWWTWLLALLLLAILLLSGKRVAWMMGALGMAAYLVYLFAAGAIRSRRTLLAAGVLAIAALSVLATQHEPLARRIDKTLGIFSQDVSAMDKATAYRLTLWGNTARIAQDHWINGVGPRGFRYAYPEYAASGDVFMKKSGGQTHPHLSVLEIAAETGLPGLCGFLLFWALLLQFAWRSLRADTGAAPWLIAAGIAWLPFNAHLAFYGSYWSSVAWWTLSLGVAVAARKMAGSAANRACRELAQA